MYQIYMYKPDLALNNLLCLICYKIKPNQSFIFLGCFFIPTHLLLQEGAPEIYLLFKSMRSAT